MVKRSEEQSIKEVISIFLDRMKLRSKFNEVQLRQAWSGIMGPTIAQYTEEMFMREKTLYIRLSSPALKNELSYSKEKLKKVVNEILGGEYVDKILFI